MHIRTLSHTHTRTHTPAPVVDVLGSTPPKPVSAGAVVVLLKMLAAVVEVPPRPPSPRLGALLAAAPGQCFD